MIDNGHSIKIGSQEVNQETMFSPLPPEPFLKGYGKGHQVLEKLAPNLNLKLPHKF